LTSKLGATGEFDKAAGYFNQSFATYIKAPFGVWTELPSGGCYNFVTGAGGFLQVGGSP
jgi:hypothetical protein